MQILMYQWNAYNGPDIRATFLALGHRVTDFKARFKDANRDSAFEQQLSEYFTADKYDMVFSVDYFTLISNVCEQHHIRYVSWSCDAALTSMYNRSIYNTCNYLFLFDKVDYLEFADKGLAHVYYLPLAPALERTQQVIHSNPDNADELTLVQKKYAHDISFVGTLYGKNKYDTMVDSFSPYLKGYLDAVIEAQLNVSGGNLIETLLTPGILEEIETHYKLEQQPESEANLAMYFSRSVLGYKVAAEERFRALQILGRKHMVTLYSSEPAPEQLRIEQAGPVDYWQEMPHVFHDSKINLNITIPNISSGIPLRVWDILAAGGFCLTNYRPELLQYFENGKDLVIYEGLDDLREKVDYYLSHEEEREQIALNGFRKVQQHSLEKRLQELLTLFC
ncbi:MAG: DUF3880 domain-containing protein [Lachnospiraceae bacterium]|nr:DUF3880 domain-containing protein [Lachnospiraceae bacterium]